MEKQSTGRVMMKLVVSVLALFLLMACGVLMGACKGEHEHNYKKSTSENMAATCGSTGYDIYECDGCGDRYAVPTYATGNHNFVNGYCTVCGLPNSYDDAQLQQLLSDINSKVEAVRTSINDLHQHDYSKETVTVNATCYASGFIAMKCECGSSAITKALDKLDHEWDAETITVPASCTTVGEVYRKCKNCETVVLYETIPVAGHKFGTEMETIVAATCTEPGYRGYKCSVCGEMGYSEQIPATDHNMVWSTKANTDGYAANCLHGDYTWYHCANENCPENWGVPTEVSAKGGHDFGFGEKYETGEFKNEEIKKANCTEARVIVRHCRACGASEGVQVTDDKNGALGHTWERKDKDGKLIVDLSKVTAGDEHIVGEYEPALCNKTGRFTYKCGECDEVINYVIAVDENAHKAVEENGAAKKIDTISQLTGNLASMNGSEDEEGKVINYHWNTVTYTHYLCEYCNEWLVKTEDIPEGGKEYLEDLRTFPEPSTSTTPTTPTTPPTTGGSTEGGEEEAPKGEYTIIKRVFFDYEKRDLDTTMKAWVDKGILGFSWHSWQDYDTNKEKTENKGAVTNDRGDEVKIGDANCETEGLHWYHCIDPNCTIVETYVITPAVGHNYDIPDTLAQWEELLSTNVDKDKEPPTTPNGHTQSEDYYTKPSTSGEGAEGHKTFSEVMNARGDIFYGADCTEYAVVFVGCTNCFLKGELVTGDKAEGEGVTHCMGDKEERRVAITVRVTVDKETKSETKELTVIDLTEDIVTEKKPTPASGEGQEETAGKILSDEKIAERILDLDAWVEAYNKKDGITDEEKINIDEIRHPIYDADVSADTVEQLYSAFEGRLKPGTLKPEGESEGKAPKLDEFRKEEKKEGNTTTNAYYVFDPLGHVWQLGKDEFKPTETEKVQKWNVRKPTPAEHLKEGEEAPTFNCTEPGYTGRWCSRACCTGKEETGTTGESPTEQIHQYDRHQKISLERDLENLKLEEGDEDPRDYAYDLHRQDKDGKEYWLVVKETGMTPTGAETNFKPEVIKGELTYEEINELFELLVERDHVKDYRVLTENVKCGDEATVNWFCINCDKKFDDKIQEVKHLGNFGHYYTIGACGTAFGEDHNIITYDYCLDCGRRVGLEVVEKKDTVTGKVSKVETRNVVWTEGDPNTLTGEPVDILPCELSTIKTNYRHFPFDRDFIDGLLKETKTETVTSGSTQTTKTVPNPNYKLYSAIWRAIDKWYETNDDELLRASCLTGLLMTKTTTDKANGWTARCHDCYTEFLSHKCSSTTEQEATEQTHYFVINNGVVNEFTSLKDLVIYFVKDDIRRGFIENNKVSKTPIPEEEIDALVEKEYKNAGTESNIKNGWVKTAGLSCMTGETWNTNTTQDNKIQVVLASHVRADIYTAKVTVCEDCKSYNWTKENGKIFTKIELTAEKASAAGAGA